jgi:glycerol-3-phosphate acyltransferase PlsY
LKGTAAVLIAAPWGLRRRLPLAWAHSSAIAFPVWLRFTGGKGVATFLGILLGLHWPAMILAALIWIGTAALTRYSSLSALVATAASPLLLLAFGQNEAAALFVVLA